MAGSSFMHSRKTKAAPESIPGLIIGRVIEKNALNGELPRLLADSSRLLLICIREVLIAPIAIGINNTRYENIRSKWVWYIGLAWLSLIHI